MKFNKSQLVKRGNLLLLGITFCIFTSAQGATIYLDQSDPLYNAADATAALQAALNNPAADTIVVKNIGTPWITSPLFVNRDNVKIVFETGTILESKLGSLPNLGDCLLTVNRRNNITIEGPGATLRMRRDVEDYSDGEYRHIISVNNSDNVTITGVTCSNSGGDGIKVGNEFGNITGKNYSENILIKDVTCDNNFRQGISVISAQNLTIDNCLLKGTTGTLPSAGIDLEPNSQVDRMSQVTIKNSRFEGNEKNGIRVDLSNINTASHPVDITFDHCLVVNNQDVAVYLDISESDGVNGTVTMKNTIIENNKWEGLLIANDAYHAQVIVQDTTVRNSPTMPNTNTAPIYMEGQRYSDTGIVAYGNTTFQNVVVEDTVNRKYLITYQNGYPDNRVVHMENVTGDITVVNPFGASATFGSAPVNVSVTPTLSAVSPTPVTLTVGNTALVGNQSLAANGEMFWRINSFTGQNGNDPGWDSFSIAGNLSIDATAIDPFTIHLETLWMSQTSGFAQNWDNSLAQTWTILTATGISGFDPSKFILDDSGFLNVHTGTFSLSQNGNSLELSFNPLPVPEPSTWYMLGIVGLLAGLKFRNSKQAFVV